MPELPSIIDSQDPQLISNQSVCHWRAEAKNQCYIVNFIKTLLIKSFAKSFILFKDKMRVLSVIKCMFNGCYDSDYRAICQVGFR